MRAGEPDRHRCENRKRHREQHGTAVGRVERRAALGETSGGRPSGPLLRTGVAGGLRGPSRRRDMDGDGWARARADGVRQITGLAGEFGGARARFDQEIIGNCRLGTNSSFARGGWPPGTLCPNTEKASALESSSLRAPAARAKASERGADAVSPASPDSSLSMLVRRSSSFSNPICRLPRRDLRLPVGVGLFRAHLGEFGGDPRAIGAGRARRNQALAQPLDHRVDGALGWGYGPLGERLKMRMDLADLPRQRTESAPPRVSIRCMISSATRSMICGSSAAGFPLSSLALSARRASSTGARSMAGGAASDGGAAPGRSSRAVSSFSEASSALVSNVACGRASTDCRTSSILRARSWNGAGSPRPCGLARIASSSRLAICSSRPSIAASPETGVDRSISRLSSASDAAIRAHST